MFFEQIPRTFGKVRSINVFYYIKGEYKYEISWFQDHYCLESMYWLYLSELMTIDNIYYPREMKITTEDRDFSCIGFLLDC
ncbi:hypothetical protein J2S00_003402 [Caldalkalibacillus uzonensis]|uniref:Uncharacterized protein n=1 Tax=Caldalkalibacillus uzonensis TaxID=353224 RepID=A0ABU0CWU1_9BACI|nr:hypothetical protein [Caldalkalibacillus uzonensis]